MAYDGNFPRRLGIGQRDVDQRLALSLGDRVTRGRMDIPAPIATNDLTVATWPQREPIRGSK